MSNKIEFEGVVYNSFTKLCKEYGLIPETVKYRMKIGMSLEEAIKNKPKRIRKDLKISTSVSVEFEGKKYMSQGELCRAYGVDVTTFSRRKAKGHTLHECIYGARDKYIIKGKPYNSLKEIANEFNISYTALQQRLGSGLTIEEAINLKPYNNTKYSLIYNNKQYNGERDLCKQLGVSYSTFRVRKKKGLSLEECLFGNKVN